MARREIICHVGPTNSGKTFAAIQHLKAARTGIYCAPLRLLAMELYERLNSEKLDCSLRTGEVCRGPKDKEDAEWSDSALLSCTVEMIDYSKDYNVAVLDEIQVMSDPQRGWAFTQALLGINARQVYLCGEESCVDLVRKIAELAGDVVHVRYFERLAPLKIAEHSLKGNISAIEPGDCVVTFSRRKIFELKHLIEKQTNRKCAVVYGKLPMESRTLQAQQFNDPKSDYRVMVASDAIGMGLNLNIKRIVFASLQKNSGFGFELVSSNQVKQIAGRAGRYQTAFGDAGTVTTLYEKDMPYLVRCLKTPNQIVSKAGLQPRQEHLEQLHSLHPELPLSTIMESASELSQLDPRYFLCDTRDRTFTARLLHRYSKCLPISDLLKLTNTPVKEADEKVASTFCWFVSQMAQGKPCPVRANLPSIHIDPANRLEIAEVLYRSLDMYLWLSNQFPHYFLEREAAENKRSECAALVKKCLEQMTFVKSNNKKLKGDAVKSADLDHIEELMKNIQQLS